MSYNGKVFSVNTGFANETVEQRLIDFEIPKEVMKELPMEFAVEAQKLLEISLEGSVG